VTGLDQGPRTGRPLDEIAGALADTRRRREAAEEAREDAMRDLTVLLAQALEAGMTVVDIARLSGVTRRTVYALMSRESAGET